MRYSVLTALVCATALLSGCGTADQTPLTPTIHEAAPVVTSQAEANTGAVELALVASGATLTVPAGALPVGTHVSLESWTSGEEHHYRVDFAGQSSFAASLLTIVVPAGQFVSLYGETNGEWQLLESGLTGAVSRPLSAATSLKTVPDDYN